MSSSVAAATRAGARLRQAGSWPRCLEQSMVTRGHDTAMTSLKEQLASYGAYHKDPRNKLTHFVGVPLVTFSLFLFLSWFRFSPAPEWPVTGATLFFLVVFLYY